VAVFRRFADADVWIVFDCSVYSWTERVNALVDDSMWVDALAVALDHYETSVANFREAVDAAEKKARVLAASGQSREGQFLFCTSLQL
jgi:hypothetical protein